MDEIQYIFVILFFAMLLGVITGAIAQKKGESFFLWWLFGTLLFIVALPLVILMGAKAGRRNQGVKKCPYCGTEMNVKEMECPSCGRGQVPRPTNAAWERTVAVEDDVEKWAKKENKGDAGQ
jgi:ribosomal protein L37E